MNFFLKYLNNLDEHTLEVVKKSSSSLVVKILGMIAGFFLSIFLGRTLGADGLGVINLANSLISLFVVICMLGTRQIIVKEVAIGLSKHDFKHISKMVNSAYILNGGFAFFTSIILIISTPFIVKYFFEDPRLIWPLTIGLIVVVPQIISGIISSNLIGYRKIWQSNLVDRSLNVAITILILVVLWINNIEITIINTAISYAVGRIVEVTIILAIWNKINTKVKNDLANLAIVKLFKTSFPLLISSVSNVLIQNGDIILVGIFLNTREVGLYVVASRIAMLSGFMLQITNAALSGNIASLYEQNKKNELQIMLSKVSKYLALIGIIPLLLYFIFGEGILGIWGQEFKTSYWILIILTIGQFFNIAAGASAQLLIMCGFQKQQSYITTIFMFLNLVLNIILINLFGLLGAASATAITTIGVNITRIIVAKNKTGIIAVYYK